jgi:hypothetical protein
MPPHTRLLDAVGNLRDSLHRPAWNPLLLPSREWNVAARGMCSLEAREAEAQDPPPAATGGVTRKILSQTECPAPSYEPLLV